MLTPGHFGGVAEIEEDDEPFGAKIVRLTAALEGQFAESSKLESKIRENLKRVTQ